MADGTGRRTVDALAMALQAPGLRRFARFGAVGLLNTGFGYLAFSVFVLAGLWPGAALAAATVAGVIFNFQTSRRLVFGTGGHVGRFITLYTGIVLLNWAALHVLLSLGLTALTGQMLLALPIAVVSYIGQSRFIFEAQPAAAI